MGRNGRTTQLTHTCCGCCCCCCCCCCCNGSGSGSGCGCDCGCCTARSMRTISRANRGRRVAGWGRREQRTSAKLLVLYSVCSGTSHLILKARSTTARRSEEGEMAHSSSTIEWDRTESLCRPREETTRHDTTRDSDYHVLRNNETERVSVETNPNRRQNQHMHYTQMSKNSCTPYCHASSLTRPQPKADCSSAATRHIIPTHPTPLTAIFMPAAARSSSPH